MYRILLVQHGIPVPDHQDSRTGGKEAHRVFSAADGRVRVECWGPEGIVLGEKPVRSMGIGGFPFSDTLVWLVGEDGSHHRVLSLERYTIDGHEATAHAGETPIDRLRAMTGDHTSAEIVAIACATASGQHRERQPFRVAGVTWFTRPPEGWPLTR